MRFALIRKTTKDILAESFLELAAKKSIDKIRISDITDNCGMSAPTFYNHFKHKYDLIVWIHTHRVNDVMSRIDRDGYVNKCIDRILDLGGEVKNETKPEAPVYTDVIEWIKYDLQVSKDGLAWLKTVIDDAKDDLTTYDILKEY